jgi:PAS domain S-box-containing protein
MERPWSSGDGVLAMIRWVKFALSIPRQRQRHERALERSRMKRGWKSIQSRLILLLILVLIPIAAIQVYMYYSLFQERKAAAIQANLELARGFVKTFEGFVQSVLHQELSIGLALTSYQKLSLEAQNRILLRSHADNPGVWEIFWASPSGIVLAATGPQFLGMRLDDRDYFRKIVSGQDYVISDLLLSRTTRKPSFTVSRGIRDEQGVLLGIVTAAILPERLDEELGIKRILGGGFGLVDTKGMMVYRYPAIEATWEERNWLKQYPQFADALKGKEAEATVYAPFEGKNRLVGFTPVPSVGWAASAGQREEEVTGPIWAAIGRSAILFGSVLLAAFLLGIVFSRKIANPVEALRRHALALGAGEEREQVAVQSISEFKDLADTFNVMAENVRMREAELRESEERLALAASATQIGMFDWNLTKGRILWTQTHEAIFGYAPTTTNNTNTTEHDYRRWADRVHPKDLPLVEEESRRCMQDRKPLEVQYRIIWPNGSLHWVETKGVFLYDSDGNANRMLGVVTDLTERKRAEAALAETKRLLETLLTQAPIGFAYFDRELRFMLINDQLAAINGLPVAAHLGKRVDDIVPTLSPAVHQVTEKILTTGLPVKDHEFSGETALQPSITRYWNQSWYPVRDGAGEIVGFGAVVEEITARKQAEEALVAVHSRLQSIINNTPALVYALDLGECFVMVNTALAELLHTTPEQMLGKRRHEFMSQQDADWHEANDRQAIAAGHPVEFEESSQLHGRSIAWLTTKFPLRDAHGQIYAVAGITTDITARKRAEEALARHRDELEARVQERTEELAKSQDRLQHLASQLLLAQEKERKRVAVELHDGLLSELAAMKMLFEAKLKLLKQGRLSDLNEFQKISDILALVVKEARGIMNNLHPSVLDELGLIPAMNWSCGEYQKSYPHIKIETKIGVAEGGVPESIRVVIYRVLQEALNNFAQHGKGDRVELSLSKSDGVFEFMIRDNGQGFDVETAQKGLGLESMRERVELSGGKFQIESVIGQGTTIRAIWRQ